MKDRVKSLMYDGETQEEFGLRVGIAQGLISRYINGVREPGLKHVLQISKATGAKVEWIATGEGKKYGKGG